VKVLEKEAEQLRAQLGDVEAQCLILTTEIAISKEREQSAKDDMEHNVEAVTSTLTESLAKANNVQREQAASLSQLEARVEELEAELTQAEAATQLERNRVQELEDKNRHESTGTAGYKQAFQAMLENEKVIEADVAKKDAQIFALQQQVQLLEIQIRWGTQRRRTLSQVSPNLESCSPIIDGEADLLGEGVHHFETEQWEKKMFGRSRWQPGSQEWRDQPPPEGYEWGSPWQIDGTHTAVDPEGWSYGSTEQELTERRQAGASNTSKAKEDMYRTRKWVRSMVLKLSV